jgi:nucleoside-diphosphate-sugar epimerase
MSERILTCLITGGSGYLGSELAAYFRKQGWRVIAASRHPQGNDSVAFSLGDDVAPEFFRGVDVLIHGAYDFAPRNWEEIDQRNVVGSEKLLRQAKASGVFIITISSISAFPACKSFYGKAKLLMEEATLAVGGIALRPGLIYGGSNQGIFGRLMKQVAEKTVVPLLSGSSCTLHLTQVEDLARVIEGCVNGVCPKQDAPWVVAHPEPWPLKNLLQAMATARGKKLLFIPVPWPFVLFALKFFEAIGLPRDFKSDNLISIVNQDPHLDFRAVSNCGVPMRPFQPLVVRPGE